MDSPFSAADGSLDLSSGDLSPIEMECMRCGETALMRFYGMCARCREELRTAHPGVGREVSVAAYEPKMNVTPNAVALKDD
jgi:hypothetical protein